MAKEDGGPAFPTRENDGYGCPVTVGGMTLRDWFAGQVAAAAMTNASGLGHDTKDGRAPLFSALAGISYELADAMLEARGK